MNCSDYTHWMAPKLEGSLAQDRLEEIDMHLSLCSRCRAELLLQKKLHHALSEESPSGLSADFTRRVSERVRKTSRSEGRLWRWPALIPAACSAVVTIFAFIYRTDLARVIPPVMERLANAVATPAAALGENVLGFFAEAADLASSDVTLAEGVSPLSFNMLAAAVIACLAVAWAFYKASTLLRE